LQWLAEHVGGVAELQLLAEPGGDFVAVDRGVSGGQVDHRLHADHAVLSEQGAESAEEHRADVFDSGDPCIGGEASALRWT